MARILIAYATKNGSTTGIAEAIKEELESSGHQIVIKEMSNATGPGGYDAVILGGPLYMGRMHKDFAKYIGKYTDTLAKVPVAAFAVGMGPVSKEEKQIESVRRALHEGLGTIVPVYEGIFAGQLDPSRLNFLTRKLLVDLGKIPTGDFRDWNAIAAWAEEAGKKLTP